MPSAKSNIDTLPVRPSNEFLQRIDEILSRQLSPENITTYADDALTDLIKLVDDVIAADTATTDLEGKDRELHALEQANLNPELVDHTLSHISDVAEFIRDVDPTIAKKTKHIPTVIVPTDTQSPLIPGTDRYEPKQIQPRLQSIVVLLEKGFGISFESDDVQLTKGDLDPNMMRKESYHLVEIDSLQRAILVCNEVGNITFVFDLEKCLEAGIAGKDLIELHKSDIEELLTIEPTLGSTIRYSKNYIVNISNALTNPFDANDDETSISEQPTAELLKPKLETPPDGYRSVTGITKNLGKNHRTVNRAVDDLGDQLGATITVRFRTGYATVYSPEQQGMIRARLEEKGAFTEAAPEGYRSIAGIARFFNVSSKTVNHVIHILGDKLGNTFIAKFEKVHTAAYSPEQQEMIRNQLEKMSMLVDIAPEEYRSIAGIAENLGVAHGTVKRAVDDLGDQLGATITMNFKGGIYATAYSPEQQGLIRARLEEKGLLLAVETAPEGYRSITGIHLYYGKSVRQIIKAINSLGSKLGVVKTLRFKSVNTSGYSPEQQEMIIGWIDNNITSKLGEAALPPDL